MVMKNHAIWIGVVDSLIGYWDPDRKKAKEKHAQRNDRIGWESLGSEEFTLDFGKEWPFAGVPQVLRSSPNGQVPPLVVSGQAATNHPYKYTVGILPNGPEDDPEIIIDL